MPDIRLAGEMLAAPLRIQQSPNKRFLSFSRNATFFGA
jgi:hypothetical protein